MILDPLLEQLDYQARVQDIRVGVFHTAVFTRDCGLAASLPKDALRQSPPLVQESGLLLDKSPLELTRLIFSQSILESAVGMATLNSLLQVRTEDCLELNAADIILERGQGKDVAIVGHFPFIQKVKDVARNLWVIEKNPQQGDFSESEAESLLPRADLVAITGTAFTNKTMENLLRLCDPKSYVIVLGDSAPLSPLLFDLGIDAVSGTRVVDPELALRCVSQGANFRQIRGIRKLTMLRG